MRSQLLTGGVALSCALLAGCSAAESAPKAAAASVSTSSTPSPSPSPTLDSAATARNTAACMAYEAGMKNEDQLESELKANKPSPVFLMSASTQYAITTVQTAASSSSGPVKDSLSGLAASLTLLKAKFDAYQSGTLDIAYEISALDQSRQAAIDACNNPGAA